MTPQIRRSPRASVNIERLVRVEEAIKSLSEDIAEHTDTDKNSFMQVTTSLESLNSKLDTLLIRFERSDSASQAISRQARHAGGTAGAIIAGIVAGIATIFNLVFGA